LQQLDALQGQQCQQEPSKKSAALILNSFLSRAGEWDHNTLLVEVFIIITIYNQLANSSPWLLQGTRPRLS